MSQPTYAELAHAARELDWWTSRQVRNYPDSAQVVQRHTADLADAILSYGRPVVVDGIEYRIADGKIIRTLPMGGTTP